MTTYHPYKVNLSKRQKDKLGKAIRGRNPISLRLKKSQLSGNDPLMLTANQIKKIQKAASQGKGVEIKVSKAQAQKVGGSFVSALFPLARSLAPTLAKTLGLSALAGLASEGASQVVKKISGSGQRAKRREAGPKGAGERAEGPSEQVGGFLIPQNKIQKLIENKHLLTNKQKEQIATALQSGGQIVVKPTKKQSGGLLGTMLASIGIPLAIEAIKKYLEKAQPLALLELADQKEKVLLELDAQKGKARQDWALLFNALLHSLETGSRRPLGDKGWEKKNQKEKDFC